jgi:hypothetical protein
MSPSSLNGKEGVVGSSPTEGFRLVLRENMPPARQALTRALSPGPRAARFAKARSQSDAVLACQGFMTLRGLLERFHSAL